MACQGTLLVPAHVPLADTWSIIDRCQNRTMEHKYLRYALLIPRAALRWHAAWPRNCNFRGVAGVLSDVALWTRITEIVIKFFSFSGGTRILLLPRRTRLTRPGSTASVSLPASYECIQSLLLGSCPMCSCMIPATGCSKELCRA